MKKIKNIFSVNDEDLSFAVGWGLKERKTTKIDFVPIGANPDGIGDSFPFPTYAVYDQDGTTVVVPADKFCATWVNEDETN